MIHPINQSQQLNQRDATPKKQNSPALTKTQPDELISSLDRVKYYVEMAKTKNAPLLEEHKKAIFELDIGLDYEAVKKLLD